MIENFVKKILCDKGIEKTEQRFVRKILKVVNLFRLAHGFTCLMLLFHNYTMWPLENKEHSNPTHYK
jgi:hypothetical protein